MRLQAFFNPECPASYFKKNCLTFSQVYFLKFFWILLKTKKGNQYVVRRNDFLNRFYYYLYLAKGQYMYQQFLFKYSAFFC